MNVVSRATAIDSTKLIRGSPKTSREVGENSKLGLIGTTCRAQHALCKAEEGSYSVTEVYGRAIVFVQFENLCHAGHGAPFYALALKAPYLRRSLLNCSFPYCRSCTGELDTYSAN